MYILIHNQHWIYKAASMSSFWFVHGVVQSTSSKDSIASAIISYNIWIPSSNLDSFNRCDFSIEFYNLGKMALRTNQCYFLQGTIVFAERTLSAYAGMYSLSLAQ